MMGGLGGTDSQVGGGYVGGEDEGWRKAGVPGIAHAKPRR